MSDGKIFTGKTTQVPQYVIDDCFTQNKDCNIIITQPRRIAAMTIAKRVADERGCELGTLVGYQVILLCDFCQITLS